MKEKTKILFVDDDRLLRDMYLQTVLKSHFHVETAVDGVNALEKLNSFHADVVITDIMMPNMDGLTLLDKIRTHYPDIFVVVVTSSDSIEDAVAAMKRGAYDYLLKPFVPEAVISVLDSITVHLDQPMRRFSRPEKRKTCRFENIIGQDPNMLDIFERIQTVANTNANVLITGETGSGKDMIASAIHYRSFRRDEPFIRVNCAALTESLTNSELFGHERGAFTGAISEKKGYFEIADKGTIFLDEIGDVPLTTQVNLLQAIETKTFQRVGGTRPLKTNARVLCATNKSLQDLVLKGLFREDLYYRINVVSVEMPPLRERKSDIPVLADFFLKKYCVETKKNIRRISKAAMNALNRYDWPGNVRELAHTMENAVIFCNDKEIVPANIKRNIRESSGTMPITLKLASWSLKDAEAEIILKVLEKNAWNQNKSANELGVARGTLYSKMEKHGISKSSG